MDQNSTITPNTNTPDATQPVAPVAENPVQNEQPASTPVQNTQPTTEPAPQASTQSDTNTQQTTSQPTQPSSNKKGLVTAGVLAVVLLLAGSVFYITGVMNSTKRLGQYKKVTVPSITVKPTQPVMSQEEMEATNVDTGDPEAELKELEQDLSTLDN